MLTEPVQLMIVGAFVGQVRKVRSQRLILLCDEASAPFLSEGILIDLLLGYRASPER